MHLIMTLLIRDEQDIIQANIDFHLSQGVDMFIVTDNLSTDNTPKILQKYKKRGVLKIINETTDDYSQYKWVTRMAQMAYTDYNADWIINSDADEFWMPDDDTKNIKQILQKVPETDLACKADRINFLPPTDANKESFFVESMLIRERKSYNAIGQPLPPKVCHRGIKEISIRQGNHHVEKDNKRLIPKSLPITILHYPLRSFSQFENKIKKGGAAYKRNTTLDSSIGSTWRDLYQKYKDGKLKDYYLEQIPNKETLSNKLATQELIEDKRLFEYITKNLNYSKLSTTHGKTY